MDAGTKRWQIGELAAATGLTARALRHYESLGLLVPSARTQAGYRLYDGHDVERLYRVRALRALGLPLEQIAEVLDGLPLAEVLERQLAAVESELAAATRLRTRLLHLRRTASVDDLIETMEAMEMHEQYFSEEQRAAIAERADKAPAGEQAWAELIADARAELASGTDPRDPRMRAIGLRWKELIDEFTGGDPAIRAGLERMYGDQGPTLASRGGVDPELMAYVQEAMRD
jgi:MerR family transcriptional regulator, thiopeptide resistance regulator